DALDAALDESLLVLGVLVLGVLGDVAVLLRLLDAGCDLRTAHVDELLELRAELLEALARDVLGLVVHVRVPLSEDAPGRVRSRGIHERKRHDRARMRRGATGLAGAGIVHAPGAIRNGATSAD